MRVHPKETLAQRDKTRDVQDSIGREIMKLRLIGKQQPVKKRMNSERQATLDEAEEAYPFMRPRVWYIFFFRNPHGVLRNKSLPPQNS